MASIQKRTSKSGETSYKVEVRLKGYPAQRATFARLTDAKRWAQHTESAIREGRHFKTSEARRHTFAEMIDRYINDVLPTKPSLDYKPHLEWWRDRLGSHTLADVTSVQIAESRDKLLTEPLKPRSKNPKKISETPRYRAPATVVKFLAALSNVYTKAEKEWGWIEGNPVRKVEKPKLPRGRVRFLSDDERERLLEACKQSDSPILYMVVVLALSTGMRKAEIMGLKWPDVDLHQQRATLHETKNGERRVLPITGHALELLKEHSKIRRLDTDLLFPGKVKKHSPIDLRTPWITALRRAEIEDFHFHDLRHSAASYLAMNGASLAEIAEVLGHKTLQMVKRYAHLSEAHTAGVVGRMNEKIFGGV